MVKFFIYGALAYFFWALQDQYTQSFPVYISILIACAITAIFALSEFFSERPAFQLPICIVVTCWFASHADVLSEDRFEMIWAPLGIILFGILSIIQFFRLLSDHGFNGGRRSGREDPE